MNDFTNDSRVLKTSKTLGQSGFDVTVFAMHNIELPIFEKLSYFNVERIQLTTRYWMKFKIIQVLKYLEFLIRAAFKVRGYDFVHCNDLSALPIGVIVKLMSKKTKVIYDAHEYQTEMNGIHGIEKFIIKIMEKFLIKFTDDVITVSDSISNAYVSLYGIEKPSLILNCPNYNQVSKQNIFREQLGISKEQTIFLYQGALNTGRGIELLIEAFNSLEGSSNVLVIMGYGRLESLVKNAVAKSNNIFFFPAVTPNVLLDHTSSADFGISFIEDSCLSYRYCLPNKMFEYLMAGLPVVVSNLVEMRSFVNENHVGVVADNNTVSGFIHAINDIIKNDYLSMEANVKKARSIYSWENQESVLLNVYNKYK
nr:glycosyltransferase family 4 protein [Pseudoalteromonas sp. Z1A8]